MPIGAATGPLSAASIPRLIVVPSKPVVVLGAAPEAAPDVLDPPVVLDPVELVVVPTVVVVVPAAVVADELDLLELPQAAATVARAAQAARSRTARLDLMVMLPPYCRWDRAQYENGQVVK
jgi:hypothetical protein